MQRARTAFTLVELLVALILLSVAAAGLVSALTGDRHLRDLAAAHTFAAGQARERLEWLAALPCAAVAGGSKAAPWGTEHWSATPASSEWHLTDSLVLSRSTAPVIVKARVICPD